jgi:DNA modification methylase
MPRFDWNRSAEPDPPAAELRVVERWQPHSDAPEQRFLLGDNLAVMQALLPELEGQVKLVCIDPPFHTGKAWSMKFPGLDVERVAFADSGWGGVDGYLDFLHRRLVLLRRLLADDGSIFLHLDYRVAHYARLVMEEVFGADRLLNEIVWSYASGGGSGERFGRKHDTILWFAKGPRHTFNADAVRVPYRAAIAASRRDKFHAEGMVSPDVWEVSRGRNGDGVTGYPTEKPEALVERMVLAASNEGDLVLDAFGGSGSLAEAAASLRRRSVSIDVSPLAMQCHRRRLSMLAVPLRIECDVACVAFSQHDGVQLRRECALLGTEFTLEGELPEELDGWCLDEVDAVDDPLEPLWLVWREKKDRQPRMTSDPILLFGSKPFIRVSAWTIEGKRFVKLLRSAVDS